jgi:cell division protein DivIC
MMVVFAVASAVAIYFEQETQLQRLAARQVQLKNDLSAAHAQEGELLDLQEQVDTDAYIEHIAREKLGMVKPNEVVFEDQ